jgi:hypothetical protein
VFAYRSRVFSTSNIAFATPLVGLTTALFSLSLSHSLSCPLSLCVRARGYGRTSTTRTSFECLKWAGGVYTVLPPAPVESEWRVRSFKHSAGLGGCCVNYYENRSVRWPVALPRREARHAASPWYAPALAGMAVTRFAPMHSGRVDGVHYLMLCRGRRRRAHPARQLHRARWGRRSACPETRRNGRTRGGTSGCSGGVWSPLALPRSSCQRFNGQPGLLARTRTRITI